MFGLGNPGSRYEKTRHNVGQMALGVLSDRIGAGLSLHKAGGAIAGEGWLRPGGEKLILAKSTGFMNLSGAPVSALTKFYKIEPSRVIVLHDELDIPFDTLRLKQGGGHGGHNGLRDIAKALGTPDFMRVRIGIGRPPGSQDTADFVLQPFSKAESVNLPVLLEDAADAVTALIDDGLLAAQNKFHALRGA